MKLIHRFAWLFLLIAIDSLYFITNRLMSGGIMLKIPLDDYIPLWKAWVIPYVLWIPWWIASYIYAAWRMEDRLYKAMVAATLLVFCAGITCFTLCPTYVIRPEIKGNDLFTKTLQFIYANDKDYNAFPSAHIYVTTLVVCFYNIWFKKQRWLWIVWLVIVSLSTLFTRQHYILDPIGGILLGWTGYRFGIWWVFKKKKYQSPETA
jgi:membrane-associated phospholipid phosphatase